jgi:AcrR family transcriptional regulator
MVARLNATRTLGVVDRHPQLTARPSSRAIARAAVRAELSQAAYELVLENGFDNVTVEDMAAAGGVSRSTFLRYFPTKDLAVLSAVEAQAEWVAEALLARPAGEDDWTALRQAIEAVLPYYVKDRANALAMIRLIMHTPALAERQLAQRQQWRTPLVEALAERKGIEGTPPFALIVKVAAALECLNLAVGEWAAAEGKVDLVGLIDEGFAALAAENLQSA